MSYREDTVDSDAYNSLPGIEYAKLQLTNRSDDFSIFMDKARAIAEGSGIEYEFGVYLIHRHWALADEEYMLETIENDNQRTSLVTTATKFKDNFTSRPSRWQLWRDGGNGYLTALEFSSDTGVVDSYEKLVNNSSSFLIKFNALLEEYEFGNILGITTLRRDSLSCQTNEHFVEENEFDRSVITAQLLSEEEKAKLIETAWPLSRDIYNGCQPNCRAYCSHSPTYNCYHHSRSHQYVPLCRPHGCVKSLM